MQAADAPIESRGLRMQLHQIPPLLVRHRRTTLSLLGSSTPKPTKPEFKTLVHFTMEFLRTVILSAAKNLTARPFTPFRVTILVCQALEARFRAVCNCLCPLSRGDPCDRPWGDEGVLLSKPPEDRYQA